MTKISYIHGVPANEFSQRGQAIGAIGTYIPYLSMTKGEMQLDLLRQRTQMFADFYPEAKEYRQAVKMIDAALNAGVHRGINFVGVIPDELQQTARIIAQAVQMTQPAAGVMYGRQNITGPGDGPSGTNSDKANWAASFARRELCYQKANGDASKIAECDTNFAIERIYNDYLKKIGHHTIYNRISQEYQGIPDRVFTKLILHDAGIEGMANASNLPPALISDWVENSVLSKNATIGAGLIGSVKTSFCLSKDPDQLFEKYYKWQYQRTGVAGSHIGIAPLIVAAIITAIVSVVGAALNFVNEVQKRKAYAMSEAKGFGTTAYSATQSDWGGAVPGAGGNDNTLTYLAIGIGAYFLLEDN